MTAYVILQCNRCGARLPEVAVETVAEARRDAGEYHHAWVCAQPEGEEEDLCRSCYASLEENRPWEAFVSCLARRRDGVRTANRLFQAGVASTAVLRDMSDNEMLKLRQIGPVAVACIREVLAELAAAGENKDA